MAPQSVRYADFKKVCIHYFGEARQEATSHAVFKTPLSWWSARQHNVYTG